MSGPAIAAIHTLAVSLPAHPDLVVHGAKGPHDRSDFLLVRVATTDGAEGYGEVSATPLWSGEDAASAEHFVTRVLAPALLGRSLAPVGRLEAAMDTVLAANPFTKAGVATALWDAYARTLGVPLAQALGGPYRAEVPIKLSLSGDGARLERAHAAATAAGFRSFKVKVGLPDGVGADVERVRLARKLVGEQGFLAVDANGGWSRQQAATALRRLDGLGLAFAEQPLEPGDLDGLRELRSTGIPVVADESVFGTTDLVRVIRADAADVVSLYIGKAGGPARVVAMGALAQAFGVRAVIGSNGELGLGAAAQLHAACAMPGLDVTLPSDIIGAHYYAEDILAEPLDSNGIRARLGDGPGLGVTPRDDLCRRFR